MFRNNKKNDPTKSWLWKLFDALLVRQLMSDIETIHDFGDPTEFVDHLERKVPDVWKDAAEIPFRLQLDGLVDFARSLFGLSVDREIVSIVYSWQSNHRRLLARAKLIHEEAEQLRKRRLSRKPWGTA